MKKQLLSLLFLLCGITWLGAQTELKVSPIQFLWGDIHVGGEFGVTPNFGIEPRLRLDRKKLFLFGYAGQTQRIGGALEAKYYFAPSDNGLDRFYGGIYGKYFVGETVMEDMRLDRERVSAGFLFGYKWISKDNIVAEINMGVGRALRDTYLNNSVVTTKMPIWRLDGYSKVALGYRFGSSADKAKKKRR